MGSLRCASNPQERISILGGSSDQHGFSCLFRSRLAGEPWAEDAPDDNLKRTFVSGALGVESPTRRALNGSTCQNFVRPREKFGAHEVHP